MVNKMKIYIHPQVTVSAIALQSNLLAGSPAPFVPVNPNIDTDDQW